MSRRRTWSVVASLFTLAACGDSFPRAQYHPRIAAEPWCKLGNGRFALRWEPSTAPPLISCPRWLDEQEDERGAAPAPAASASGASTLAELVVPPSAEVELPVELSAPLRDVGCVVGELLLAHGQTPADLAISVKVGAESIPIVEYAAVPAPPPVEGPDVRVRLGDGAPSAPSAPSDGPGERSPSEPRASAPAAVAVRLSGTFGGWTAGAVIELAAASEGYQPRSLAAPLRPIELLGVVHPLEVPAASSFAIVLRARSQSFSIGVRSASESEGARLRYRAPGAFAAQPTSLVPQAAVTLHHCLRRAPHVFRDLHP